MDNTTLAPKRSVTESHLIRQISPPWQSITRCAIRAIRPLSVKRSADIMIAMSLSRKEVQNIAKLARLGLSEEEVVHFEEQLSQILHYFEILRELDTDGIPTTMHSAPFQDAIREDEPTPSSHLEETLANAPWREGDQFRVRAVLE